MPEGENSESEQPESATEESIEEESIEDIAARIDAEYTAILERLAAIESTLTELSGRSGGYEERFNGIDARFESTVPGGNGAIVPDHGPEPTHWYFRKVGGKSF